jgi:RNA polymerase sigma-B factor
MMGLLLDSEDRPATSAWEALQPLLPELPERERIAVTMRFCDAVPQSYIAARMGVPPAQVEGLLRTALARLRNRT